MRCPPPFRHPTTGPRTAFTMIELMVVIGIIVVLAGLLIPTIGLVQRKAQWAQSANNLQQLYLGIDVYRTEVGHPPYLLSHLFLAADADDTVDDQVIAPQPIDGPLKGQDRDLLIDPADFSTRGGGATNETNRGLSRDEGGRWENLENIIQNEPLTCSYFYETSGAPFDQFDWYVEGMSLNTNHDNLSRHTWIDYKVEQLQRGNTITMSDGSPDDTGKPFDPNFFPIVRSFWHYNWRQPLCLHEVPKVLTLSWNGSVFPSIPFWEYQINPEFNEQFISRDHCD